MSRHRVALAAAVVIATMLSGCAGDDPTASDAQDTTVVVPSPSTPAVDTAGATETSVAPSEPELGPPSRLVGELDGIALAAAFDTAFTAVLDPATAAADVAAAGVQIQLLLRYLANHSDLDATVVAALGPSSRPTLERIVAARQFGQARAAADPTPSEPSASLPAWTIVAPEPVDVLRGHYDAAEALTGVPWYWLAAINVQETRMGRIVGVSSAGATGPMQFLPSTWAECCTGDLTLTGDAIMGAATYLAQNGAPTDMQAAVHQYNPNDSYVMTVTAYAESLRDQPALLPAFHAWQVFIASAAGTVRLPIGFTASEPIDAATYLAAHPADAA